MFKSYFSIAWRTIRKDRFLSLLNLVGLSMGLACTLFIYLWVTDELAMDRYHDKDSRIGCVGLFSLAGLFILVIACINFMNLFTAKISKRMKEAGGRKYIGASRASLILQFLGESLVMSCISLVLAVLLLKGLLPVFNSVTGKQMTLLPDNPFVGVLLAIVLITGILAGCYPALYLSGFRPVVLKRRLKTSVDEGWVRKGLVVFEFTLTLLFIVKVSVVYNRIQYRSVLPEYVVALAMLLSCMGLYGLSVCTAERADKQEKQGPDGEATGKIRESVCYRSLPGKWSRGCRGLSF